MINSDYLKNLNNAQKEAVLYLEGPLLIVAGCRIWKNKGVNLKNCTHYQRKESIS
jgi:hypothetical protein